LEKFFRQSPNVGLIAENGGFIKASGKKKWVALAKNADFSWREHVEKIFQYYQERTPGSTVFPPHDMVDIRLRRKKHL
jgi:trehalose-6-phosphatase